MDSREGAHPTADSAPALASDSASASVAMAPVVDVSAADAPEELPDWGDNLALLLPQTHKDLCPVLF